MKMEDVMDNSALKGELINGLAEAFNETQSQKQRVQDLIKQPEP